MGHVLKTASAWLLYTVWNSKYVWQLIDHKYRLAKEISGLRGIKGI
jgi:hypothetical protein